MSAAGGCVGFIYPDHAAESDYPQAARQLGVDLPVVHVYGTDLHAVPELMDLGSPAKLAHGMALLAPQRPAAVVWACTSGSFVFGPQGAARQVDLLAAEAGVPASSTSFAFVHALAALGCRSVAIAASYPHDIAELFADFLAAHGIDVTAMGDAGIPTAAEVGRLTRAQVRDLALRNDTPRADALLIPDTAMHTITQVDELERLLGKPVLTANAVTVWEGLRIAGIARRTTGLGALFEDRR
ncbi:putative decarboxylase [Mycolicibacter terrae]|uniref:Decarboxylase n=1 Tax=Mycolicibacter terrae TaxID=1788 RepID=A0AAD1HWY8_9MYCO|nr:maleate cis-trans isomerase [Mycolicibacter terrae]ORW89509.1 maleate cis-trans isomerase [Mycolicibacter terrae]BBX21990.1 putative decarboxylase [Mycolicibacter terrae]SNV81913.1 maleate cis-trans isomerase [Mycolicibacter terrae]